MRQAHTVEQVRAAEAARMAELPEGALMQAAAAGLASAVLDFLGGAYGRRVMLLVGSGDNGGDALYAGARLARRGARVEAVLLGAAHEQGLAAFRAAGGRVVSAETRDGASSHSRPDLVVDGIVGIGGRPGLRDDAVAALEQVAGIPVVSVDVPSGVGVDDGRLEGAHVTADLTVTFGTYKVAHLVEPAAGACGAVTLVDLGLDLPSAAVVALQPDDVAGLLPRPEPSAQKYSRGVVGVRAGSRQYPGAGVLCVSGAATGIAGMVRYEPADDDRAAVELVLAAHPEVVAGTGRVQCWVVGSGGGDRSASALAEALADAREHDLPVVVDADALQHVDTPAGARVVLTPHAGELAAMLGVERAEVEARGLEHVRRAAREYDATVLLKGRHTLVARPDGPDGTVCVNTTGVPWLATAGAGDVLAGLIGSLLAAGLAEQDAASLGAWLHGAAATLASAGGPIRASEVARAIPEVIRRLGEA